MAALLLLLLLSRVLLLTARCTLLGVCMYDVRQMAMLNAARKARIQGYLDKDPALQQAARGTRKLFVAL